MYFKIRLKVCLVHLQCWQISYFRTTKRIAISYWKQIFHHVQSDDIHLEVWLDAGGLQAVVVTDTLPGTEAQAGLDCSQDSEGEQEVCGVHPDVFYLMATDCVTVWCVASCPSSGSRQTDTGPSSPAAARPARPWRDGRYWAGSSHSLLTGYLSSSGNVFGHQGSVKFSQKCIKHSKGL